MDPNSQTQPAANMPPVPLKSLVSQQAAAATPVPLQAPLTPAVPPKKQSSLKKILLIAIFLVTALIILFLVVRVLVPQFTKILGNKKVELTYWGLWEDPEVMKSLISDYQAQNPNITINYIPQAKEDYRERLTNALASGNGPDIFKIHNSWVPMFFQGLSILPDDVMTSEEYITRFYSAAQASFGVSGGYVAIPLSYDALGLYINEDIFRNFGKTTPISWTEVRDIAIETTIKDQNGIIKQAGIALGTTSNVDHWQEILALMMIQNGADLKNPSDELSSGALEFYRSFSDEWEVWNNTLPPSTTYFASGRMAMYLAPVWRAREILAQNPSLQFRIIKVPQLPKESPNDPDITYATFWAEAVSNKSENEKEAWEFLKYLTERQQQEKLFSLTSQVASFGNIYSRVDMQDLLTQSPYLGGIASQAKNAKTWYLASRTFDGQTGLNSLLENEYKTASEFGVFNQNSLDNILLILSKYGLAKAPAATATN